MDSVLISAKVQFQCLYYSDNCEKIAEIERKKMLREGISNNSETEAKELDLTQFYPLTLLLLHKWKRLCSKQTATQTTSGN